MIGPLAWLAAEVKLVGVHEDARIVFSISINKLSKPINPGLGYNHAGTSASSFSPGLRTWTAPLGVAVEALEFTP